jgi:hypothetical protein
MASYDLRHKKGQMKSILPPLGESGTTVRIAEALRRQAPGLRLMKEREIMPIPWGVPHWFRRWDGRLRILERASTNKSL